MSDAPAETTVTILVVDIVSSTALYERLGNVKAKRQVDTCLEWVSAKVLSNRGEIIKSLGDGLLCALRAEEEAVGAALLMTDDHPDRLRVRVGVHCGEVVRDDGDVFGDAVNTASRIASLAKPSEILISGDLRKGLPKLLKSMLRRVQPVNVKGKKEPIELFTIVLGDASQTMAPVTMFYKVPDASTARLELEYEDSTLTLTAEREATLGRDSVNEFVVPSQHVSRRHARIFHRQGKFVLADESANGTFLVPNGQSKFRLLREESPLHGEGVIYLGVDPDVTPSKPIRYRST